MTKPSYCKYGNTKVKCEGEIILPLGGTAIGEMTFDSKDEADRYFCLLDRYKAGEILKLERQPKLMLIPKLTWQGRVVQMAVTYTPDFYIEYKDGSRCYEDVKGFSTQQGDLRRKLYNWLSMTNPNFTGFGVPLKWIASNFKHGDADGWIDYDELQKIRAKNRKEKKGA